MTKKPIVVSKNIMAAEALNIMEYKQITSLVVINDDKTVAGLLTLNQLLKSGIE
jgi:arabinose-5-phosphate isomerase